MKVMISIKGREILSYVVIEARKMIYFGYQKDWL